MKILLVRYLDKENINTRLPDSVNKAQGVYPALGIAYLGAVLEKAGYNVKILDVPALNLTSDEACEAIQKIKADIVGITTMTSNYRGALEAAKFAKDTGAITVLGGPHVSAYPKESVLSGLIDYGIQGEAEYSLLKLVKLLEKKIKSKIKEKDFESELKKIKGVIYKKNVKGKEEIFVNPPDVVMNLDELPLPAMHLLPVEKYDCVITEKPVLTMITSRGCPFQCGFCFKQPMDKIFRKRDPKKVVDEIEELIKRYRLKEILFYDDTITLDKKHISAICNEIIKRKIKIKWQAPTRIDCIDRSLLLLMKKAGCRMLRYGVESGDEGILKIMRKGTDLTKVKNAFKLSKEVGIETFAYFIIGYAGENEKTMRKTISFAKELDPDMVMFTVATPYPKTNLYDLAEKAGCVSGDYWLDFTLGKTDKRLGYFVKDADKWVRKAYIEFYFRPKFILGKLRKLNSVDGFKKNVRGAMSLLKV